MYIPLYTVKLVGTPANMTHYLNLRSFSMYPDLKMCLHSVSFRNIPHDMDTLISISSSLVTQLDEVMLNPKQREKDMSTSDFFSVRGATQYVTRCRGKKDKTLNQQIESNIFFQVTNLTAKTRWHIHPESDIKPAGWDTLGVVLHYSFYG